MDNRWLTPSFKSSVNFDTRNRLLGNSSLTANSKDTALLKNNNVLYTLTSTENRILSSYKSQLDKKETRRQFSFDSDEPSTKKIKEEIEYSSFIDTDDGTECQYKFNWPEICKVKLQPASDARIKSKFVHKMEKENLLNAVSVSLMQGPNLKNPNDPFRTVIIEQCEKISEFDPEFILKMALYSRQELNIRTTTTLLLAFAAVEPRCRKFLKKYFKACVLLPTDWVAVAEQYQFLCSDDKKVGSLPVALRKVLVSKFLDFDVYQLAKHNKGKGKKKEISWRKNEAIYRRATCTLKQLVSLLHISQPADYVMGILGKKYPASREEFSRSGLSGMWDESRAGKRIKLPIPVTWETELSAKGNKKKTWEDLIDAKKLPYMAMLRNLRSLILADLSKKHHEAVTNYIKNKNAVIRSRQFPYRFYTALDIIEDMHKIMYIQGEPEHKKKYKAGRETRTVNSANYAIERKKKAMREKILKAKSFCSESLLLQYKKALQEAMTIAAFHNIPPIAGRTILYVDTSDYMNVPCLAAKGLGKPMEVSKLAEMMTDMCLKVCERCDVIKFCTKQNEYYPDKLITTFTVEDTTMAEVTRTRKMVNTVMLITIDDRELDSVKDWIRQHRVWVNPNLLYVHIALHSAKSKVNFNEASGKNLSLVGYTDALFKFVSEHCSEDRLGFIDNLDKKYQLGPLPVQLVQPSRHFISASSQFCWQEVKVFISSTFLDMQSERDLLVRHIFPELRRRAKALCMNVYEVDLRWGINENNENSISEICLAEVLDCQLFVGILGDRYGFVPDTNRLRLENEKLRCLCQQLPSASITELEFHLGALLSQDRAGRAFFYLRDSNFLKDVPTCYQHIFQETDVKRRQQLEELKKKVCSSGYEVYDGYPCNWGGISAGQPNLLNLEKFGQRVLDNMWNCLLMMREDKISDDSRSGFDVQEDYAARFHRNFIGCEKNVAAAMKTLAEAKQGLVLLTGKRGAGKTSLMAHLYNLVNKKWSHRSVSVPFFAAAVKFNFDLNVLINYLMDSFDRIVDMDDFKIRNSQDFYDSTEKIVEKCGRLYLFLDEMDCLTSEEKQNEIVNWLNVEWPKNVIVICSCTTNQLLYKKLRHSNTSTSHVITLGKLVLQDRNELIRRQLAKHGKKLDETFFNNQLKQLSMKRDSDLPLYLTLACEELKYFGHFESLTDKVRLLKNTLEGLLEDSIAALETEFGSKYVAAAFAFWSISPNGLSERELFVLLGYVDLLNQSLIDDIRFMYLHRRSGMPPAIFTTFIRAAQRIIQTSDATISVASSAAVLTLIKTRYRNSMFTATCEIQLHRIVAGFLWNECYDEGEWTGAGNKSLLNLSYHLLCGGCHLQLKELLCDLKYLQARFTQANDGRLLEEYRYTLDVALASNRFQEMRKEVEEFQDFVKRNWKTLVKDPTMILQEAVNEIETGYVCAAATDILEESCAPVMKLRNRCNVNYNIHFQAFAKSLCVTLSYDGELLAFGDATAVHLYSMVTESKLKSFVGHSAVVTCLVFVGQARLCSGSDDGMISIWNVEQGHRLFILKKHMRRVSCMCVDSTGRFLISSSWDGEVFVWRLSDGERISTLDWNNKWSAVSCVAAHPQKSMIVTGSWDSKLRIWCLQTLKRKSLLHGHTSAVIAVAISSCGSLMASSGMDYVMKIWSCSNGFQIATVEQDSLILCLNFWFAEKNKDDYYLITGNSSGIVKMYSCKMGQHVNQIDMFKKVALTCLLLKSETLIVGYEDGSIVQINLDRNYDCENKIQTIAGDGPITCLHTVDEHDKLFVGMDNGKINIFNENLCFTMTISGHNAAISAIAVSKKQLVSGDVSGVIGICNRPWKKETTSFTCLHMSLVHDGGVTSLSFNNDYSTFASTGNDRVLRIWRSSDITKNLQNKMDAFDVDGIVVRNCHTDFVTSSCWTERTNSECSESIVVTAGKDLRICAWDPKDGNCLWTKSEFNAPIKRLFSTRMMICASALDGSFYVFDPTGITLCEVLGQGHTLVSVFFDLAEEIYGWYRLVVQEEKDRERFQTKTKQLNAVADDLKHVVVASCGPDGEVHITKPCFNTKPKKVIRCHTKDVLVLSHGGRDRFATCSSQGNVCVWSPNENVVTSAEISCLYLHKKNDDKIYILAGDRSGCVTLWVDDGVEWCELLRNKVHNKVVTSVAVVGHLKSAIYLATCSDDRFLRLWALALPKTELKTPLKLKFCNDEERSDMYTCLSYLATDNCLSAVFTDPTLISHRIDIQPNSQKPCSITFQRQTGLNNSQLERKFLPSILFVKLLSDTKMELIFAFTINSVNEMWLSTQKKSLQEHSKCNYGFTYEENSSEFNLDAYPTSMDAILLKFSNEHAVFHQLIGLLDGSILSLRVEYNFEEETATIIHRSIYKIHEAAVRGLSILKISKEDDVMMVFTGGDDGIVRELQLTIEDGSLTIQESKFQCRGAVTCVECSLRDKTYVYIVASDILGNVYAITYNSSLLS